MLAVNTFNDTHIDELVLYLIQFKNSTKYKAGCFRHFLYVFTQSIKVNQAVYIANRTYRFC